MADLDGIASPLLSNIPDDSIFVHQAMEALGFFVRDFGELSTDQMQLTLMLAAHLKRASAQPEFWES